MKGKLLKKIIAIAVLMTTVGTVLPNTVFATGPDNYYNWQYVKGSYGYWKKYDGKWHFYNSNGILQKGWVLDKGRWYFSDCNGEMQSGVIQIDGKTYVFAGDGEMQTGSAIVGGKYYNLNSNGAVLGDEIPTPKLSFDGKGVGTLIILKDEIVKGESSSPIKPASEAYDPKNPVKFTIKFKDDDGEVIKSETYERDARFKLYKPKKEDYEFVQWSTRKNGEGDIYETGDYITLDGNMTLYAQWEDSEDSGEKDNRVLVEEIFINGRGNSQEITTDKGTLQMESRVLPVDVDDKGVTWAIEGGSGKATISDSGLLKAEENGIVTVVATAKDGSGIRGVSSVIIKGQSAEESEDTDNDNTNDNTDQLINKEDVTVLQAMMTSKVTIDSDKNVYDLPLLKASGLLPKNVQLKYDEGKIMNAQVTDWKVENNNVDFSKSGSVTVTAEYDIDDKKYKVLDSVVKPKISVQVEYVAQSDIREEIIGASNLQTLAINDDNHLISIDNLKSSGKLPKEVSLNTVNNTSVNAEIKDWEIVGQKYNGYLCSEYTLKAKYNLPAGYKLATGISQNPDSFIKVRVDKVQTALVSNVQIVSEPTDMEYVVGETLILDGLVLKVTYNDGSVKDISYSDDEFINNGILTNNLLDGQKLSINDNNKAIEIVCGSKTVSTLPIKVGIALHPTLSVEYISFDKCVDKQQDLHVSFDRGTGEKRVEGNIVLAVGAHDLKNNTDYVIDEANKDIVIKSDYLKSKDVGTYTVNVIFNNKDGDEIKRIPLTVIVNDSTKRSAPNVDTIVLEPSQITNKATKISLVEKDGVGIDTLEYVICEAGVLPTTQIWYSYRNPVEYNIDEGKIIYVRKKATTYLPPSEYLSRTVTAGDISSLSAENKITSFKFEASKNAAAGLTKDVEGKVTAGEVKVVLPFNETTHKPIELQNLIPTFTLSAKDGEAKVTVGDNEQVSGVTANNYSGVLNYRIQAQLPNAIRNYVVLVYAEQPQKVTTRDNDNLITEPKEVVTREVVKFADGSSSIKETTKIQDVPFDFTEYYKEAGIVPETINEGDAKFALPEQFVDQKQIDALKEIIDKTPLGKDNSNTEVYVALKLIDAPNTAKKVKVAKSRDALSIAETIDLTSYGSSVHVFKGTYMQYVSAVYLSGTDWKGNIRDAEEYYYEWLDGQNDVVGYSRLRVMREKK